MGKLTNWIGGWWKSEPHVYTSDDFVGSIPVMKVQKIGNRITFRVTQETETIETLEGPVTVSPGFIVINRSVDGDKPYPMSLAKFEQLHHKIDWVKQTAVQLGVVKYAIRAPYHGTFAPPWNSGPPLEVKKGSIVVLNGDLPKPDQPPHTDIAAIRREIFAQTYVVVRGE